MRRIGRELGTRTQLARFKGALTALVLPVWLPVGESNPRSSLSESEVLPLNEPALWRSRWDSNPRPFRFVVECSSSELRDSVASPTGFEPASIRLRRAMRFRCATGRNWPERMELNHRREAFQTSALPLSYFRIETGERGWIRTNAGASHRVYSATVSSTHAP